METCKVCNQSTDKPFRVWENDRIVMGCVSKFHTESLKGVIGQSTSWHFSKGAKQIRSESKQ